MGQVQSEATVQNESEQSSASPSPHNTQPAASIESLITEAAAYGGDENESLDAKARKALECPCIADLRNGACGAQFSEAFLCFMKSTSNEKCSDCVHPFVALQNCIKANPDAFSEDILGEEEVMNKEVPPPEYKIIPPVWSRERRSSKSKL